MSDYKNHGDKPIEFCGDQEGWIAVGSLTDDSPLSPCHPRVVLLGVGLGPSGRQHDSNIAAMLTIEQATDLRERLTAAMGIDRPAPTPTVAPGIDLDAAEKRADGFRGRFRVMAYDSGDELLEFVALDAYNCDESEIDGGDVDEIAQFACDDETQRAIVDTLNEAPALIAEVRALRAKLAEAKRLGLEACAAFDDEQRGDGWGPTAGNRTARIAAIAAALEAL